MITNSDIDFLQETKKFMTKNFKMKNLEKVSFVLGILRLSQESYINKVLDKFGMKDKPGDTTISKEDKFSLKQCPTNDFERTKIPYASIVKSLMYAQVCTHPDI